MAALDATKDGPIATRFGVKGYPTVKYFSFGEFKFDVNVRDADKIIEFMKVCLRSIVVLNILLNQFCFLLESIGTSATTACGEAMGR